MEEKEYAIEVTLTVSGNVCQTVYIKAESEEDAFFIAGEKDFDIDTSNLDYEIEGMDLLWVGGPPIPRCPDTSDLFK